VVSITDQSRTPSGRKVQLIEAFFGRGIVESSGTTAVIGNDLNSGHQQLETTGAEKIFFGYLFRQRRWWGKIVMRADSIHSFPPADRAG